MIAVLPRLHAVTDDRVVQSLGAEGLCERAALMARAAGPALAVHLRTRALEGGKLLELARALRQALLPGGAWLVMNDRADIARAVPGRAVVTGSAGLSAGDVRMAAPGLLVGRSVHDDSEARRAADEPADFLVAGSVFVTPTHPGRVPGGVALVRAAAATRLPVIAIGGIVPGRTAEIIAAGAHGVAAIRALWDARDPEAAAREFLAHLPATPTVGVTINGEARRARRGITLAGLLADLSLDQRAVVVEHNRHIVRREQLDATPLSEGDQVELVHFVGGG